MSGIDRTSRFVRALLTVLIATLVVSATGITPVGGTTVSDTAAIGGQDPTAVEGQNVRAQTTTQSVTETYTFENEAADSGVPENFQAVIDPKGIGLTRQGPESVTSSVAYGGTQSYTATDDQGGNALTIMPESQPYTQKRTGNVSVALRGPGKPSLKIFNQTIDGLGVGEQPSIELSRRGGDLVQSTGSGKNTIATASNSEWMEVTVFDIDPAVDTFSIAWETPGASGVERGLPMRTPMEGGYDSTVLSIDGYQGNHRAYIDNLRIAAPQSSGSTSPVRDHSAYDANLSSGAIVWQGQDLYFKAANPQQDAGRFFQLREADSTPSGAEVGSFVREFRVDSNGTAIVDTNTLEGNYVVLDPNGNVVETNDRGEVTGTVSTESGIEAASFEVAVQALSANFEAGSVAQGQTFLDVQSNRGAYTLHVSGGPSSTDLVDVFDDEYATSNSALAAPPRVVQNDTGERVVELQIERQDANLTANFSTIAAGNYTLDFAVADTSAASSDSISVTRGSGQSQGQVTMSADAPANVAPGQTATITYTVTNTATTSAAGGKVVLSSVPAPLSATGQTTKFIGFNENPPGPGESVTKSFDLQVPSNATTGQSVTVTAAGTLEYGSGSTANATTTTTITIGSGVARFDTNGQRGIQSGEVVDAIVAFNTGSQIGGQPVTTGDVVDVIVEFNSN